MNYCELNESSVAGASCSSSGVGGAELRRFCIKASVGRSVDHSQKMLRQTGSGLWILALALVGPVLAKPSPTVLWQSGSKSAAARSLGPPFSPGMNTITIPYMPKTSPFFPKFVDPAAMISKKTDLLSNLFGGIGPAVPLEQTTSGALPILYSVAGDQVPEKDPIAIEDTSADKIKRASKLASPKPAPFKPFGPKFGPFGPKMAPFSPFAPNFFPMGPSFGPYGPFAPGMSPMSGFPSKFGPGLYDDDSTLSRRRRSLGTDADKALGPPPAYPGLATIAEEPENLATRVLKMYDPASTPKETLPGIFGPFGPYGPYGGAAVDPAAFIPKKATFLDTLFKTLVTTPTPEIPEPIMATEIPVPKSTIVPPDFWAPSSIIPGPTEYADKVNTFLDKLFTTVIMNKTAAAMTPAKTMIARAILANPEQGKLLVSRSIEDIKTIATAKDSIVSSILAELGDLKADMITTLNDYIIYEKTRPVGMGTKKPFKPSPFAAFFAPPTPDPSLPFKQRMAVLSQVFDMLTDLQKNITMAVQDAIKAADVSDQKTIQDYATQKTELPSAQIEDQMTMANFNATLMDALKNRLATLDQAIGAGFSRPIGSTGFTGNKIVRTIPRHPISFWVVYDRDDAAPAKRDIEEDEFISGRNREQFKRGVQMQMHQGYQSMPPGTIESVQAGGGAVPGHQGGGIKLLDSQNDAEDWRKWAEWGDYFKNQYGGRNHHHNHH